MTLNPLSLSKLKECLELAGEFVKDENSYSSGGTYGGICCSTELSIKQIIKKKSDDIRAKAELEAAKLEKQEKCANLIKECLEYLRTVDKFENTVTKCECQNKQ